VAGFEIRDGGLVYVDEASGRRIRLAKWSLDVGEWKAGATFPVETSLTFRNESIPTPPPVAKPSTAPRAAAPLEIDLRAAGRVHVSDDGNDIDIFGLEATNHVRGGPLPQKGVPVDLQVSRLAARLSPLDIGISEITGRVADVRPYVERAAACVVPLRVGGGTRLKIFEAMAMEKAVISTRIGAEGLPVRDGVELMLADGPRAFADAVVRVLRDPALAHRLGCRAAAKVREEFGWGRAAAAFGSICHRTWRAYEVV
jgi:hypothetical protein